MTHHDEILATLTDDGDTFDLEDGRTLVLRVLPDEHGDPFDFDCYGAIAPYTGPWDRDGLRTNGRPADFDGNAEIIWLQQNGGPVWWQPPKDVKRSDPGFDDLRRTVNDLASFGMVGYVVELLAPEAAADHYGRRPVLEAASLWGVEPFADAAYVTSIVADLVGEVLA